MGETLLELRMSGLTYVLTASLNLQGGSHVARVMFGYSGWAPRQLENEIRRGDW
jgi:putative AlgH/UPF0301 family transcriptional regulator